MKRLALLLPVLLALVTTEANAIFFFFIPGSVTSKIGDALTGAEGDSCVPATAKIGDTIPSSSGNTAVVKSLSGTSSRCQDPRFPIRALLLFNITSVSKAGINVPDGFEQKPLTDMQRFNGSLLRADGPGRMSFLVFARPKTATTDIAALARSVGANISGAIENAKTSREEELKIKGLRALRFEVEGKNKGLFGPTFTYVVTVVEGAEEYVVVNAWAPTKADFEKERGELRNVAAGLELSGGQPPTVAAQAESASPTPLAPIATASQPAAAAPAAAGLPATQVVDAPHPAAPAPLSNADSVANRLRELEKLCKEGVLTETDCVTKKQELLKAL